jgi:hypothetical protein
MEGFRSSWWEIRSCSGSLPRQWVGDVQMLPRHKGDIRVHLAGEMDEIRGSRKGGDGERWQ